MGSKVKPKRRRKKKTKDNRDKKGVTKNNSDEDGKGKEKTVTTPVATAQAGEMDLDDRWADQAFVPAASTCTPLPWLSSVLQPTRRTFLPSPRVSPWMWSSSALRTHS